MKRFLSFFIYELKKNIWTLVVLSALCIFPYVSTLSSMEMKFTYETEGTLHTYIETPQIGTVLTMLGILCFVVPVLVFSFKMNKRGVDAYYSLPLKKEKLYLVKSLVGLILVFVPFTLAYWLGFLALLVREGNPYQMAWYVPGYFGAVYQGLMLFGINAFLFTRANKTSDGVIFMLAYTLLGPLICSYLSSVLDVRLKVESYLMTFGGLVSFGNMISNAIVGGNIASWSYLMYTVPAIFGTISWALLFFNLRFERAEDAEQISESWFGYKVVIPLYTAFLLGTSSLDLISICMTTVGAIVATVVFRRKFRFSWKWWVMIGGAVLLGLALGAIPVY